MGSEEESLAFWLGRATAIVVACAVVWLVLKSLARGLRHLLYRWLAPENHVHEFEELRRCTQCGLMEREKR